MSAKPKIKTETVFVTETIDALPRRTKGDNTKIDEAKAIIETVMNTGKPLLIKTNADAIKKRREMNIFKYSFKMAKATMGDEYENVQARKINNELYVFVEEAKTEDEE